MYGYLIKKETIEAVLYCLVYMLCYLSTLSNTFEASTTT